MQPLVTPAFVADRLHTPDLVLLDATLPPVGVLPKPDMQARYLAAHVPGAMFFDIDALSDHATALPHMLPSAEQFAADMGQLGVADDALIVVYEQGVVFSAPRAWWMLRTLGASRVFVLEGGLRAWIAAGLPVVAGPVVRAPATFRARLDATAVKHLVQVQQGSAGTESVGERSARTAQAPVALPQILDARSADRFDGTAPEPRPGLRSGHMPGSQNLPYTALLQDDRLKSAEELQAIFAAHGVDLEREITTTCGSGITAAVLALGLELCGARYVSLYDGSWAEYAGQPDVVIETASSASASQA